jgi:hypothetical protein
LVQHGCEFEGDRFELGMGWFAPDGMPFTLPEPIVGWFDADVIDQILADRWIWAGPAPMTRYPDEEQE